MLYECEFSALIEMLQRTRHQGPATEVGKTLANSHGGIFKPILIQLYKMVYSDAFRSVRMRSLNDRNTVAVHRHLSNSVSWPY